MQLALKHNHLVRIASFQVEEKKHAKDVAHSAYFPVLRNDSSLFALTDTQFIGIAAGSLGTVAGAPFPTTTSVINQGGTTLITSGTGLTQPLTDLWKIKPANDVATAELNANARPSAPNGKRRRPESSPDLLPNPRSPRRTAKPTRQKFKPATTCKRNACNK